MKLFKKQKNPSYYKKLSQMFVYRSLNIEQKTLKAKMF